MNVKKLDELGNLISDTNDIVGASHDVRDYVARAHHTALELINSGHDKEIYIAIHSAYLKAETLLQDAHDLVEALRTITGTADWGPGI